MAVTITHLAGAGAVSGELVLSWSTGREAPGRVHKLADGGTTLTLASQAGTRSGVLRVLVPTAAAAVALEDLARVPGVLRVQVAASATFPAMTIDLVVADGVIRVTPDRGTGPRHTVELPFREAP